MTLSSLTAVGIGMLSQGFSLADGLTSAADGFTPAILQDSETAIQAISPELKNLVTRGGLYSMVGNFVMIVAAFILASALELSGALPAHD